ncbi:FAD-binding oxidoreductase [Endozoicomonas sp. SCSIO W0465]|uniref:NAD(P)/FAD-dependent oxidoreductase n=1 Tax=Endozoicomonas sp. SCSIO W0465 TaxID=2918516 RepID=UPI002075BD5B|nr:FAD-binding oxidoreductase [Endozoicomonas sp. SCSIO W0465]USE38157.1 FAD-binding oxidoreductase [Endozoicomonas sp. SCSIO W0465]
MAVVGKSAVVLGAGMVGVCVALHLQKSGYRVTLVDRKTPGMEASYGNAGLINRGSVFPLSLSDITHHLSGALLKNHPNVHVHLSQLPHYWHWLYYLLIGNSRSRYEASVKGLDSLFRHAVAEHKTLLAMSGGKQQLMEKGWLRLYRQEASFRAVQYQRDYYDRLGIRYDIFDPEGISELEPAITSGFCKGVLIRDTASLVDPSGVINGYVNTFQSSGGQFCQVSAENITRDSDGFLIETHGENIRGHIRGHIVVLALGSWSGELCEKLGYSFPMAAERGYHQQFQPSDAFQLSRPIHDVDGGYVMSPMNNGLRLTTGIELSARDAPPVSKQLYQASRNAREVFSLGNPVGAVWVGSRPSMPDGLPVIGEAPRHPGLWFAFGHGHAGVGTGAVTGRVISELISKARPVIDVSPFSPVRFVG